MKENKKCYNCKWLDRYYTKGTKKFNKAKCGWCCKRAEIVNSDFGCEEYKYWVQRKFFPIFLKHAINDILTEISEVRKILETEKDLNE